MVWTLAVGGGLSIGTDVPSSTATISLSQSSISLLSSFSGATYTARWQSAVASGVTAINVDESGSLTAQIDIPSGMIVYGNWRIVTKAFNGDMFTMAGGAQIHDLQLSGNGTVNTGRGIVISTGTDQRIINCNVSNMNGYCLEFTADSAGQRALVQGGFYQRTTATNPSIRCGPTALETAGERKFAQLQSGGGNLFDTAGSQNTHISDCSMAQMTFGTNGVKTTVIGCRIATSGADWNVGGSSGGEYVICDNIVAGNIVIVSGVANSYVRNNRCVGLTDSSGNSSNWVDAESDITPVLAADSGSPTVGNGTLTGRAVRRGKHIRAEIQLICGSSTSLGTGAYFTMPTGWNMNVKRTGAKGSIYAVDSGTGVRTGVTRVGGGIAPKIYMASDNQSTVWGSSTPITWATNDVIELVAEWEIG